ncbi:hypothetical protein M878_30835 [Streptomyces roseochromogenus subsp. oscitans DS 12.976]|uniref:Uncharacterized protein n=1 Tax=Streptomyces roseochromogenus subsp. oscitans DS 12.976 TaxID=1352936 RepID=V6JZ50_STRRC|nr:hypothetical protein M878_30835 [Streptomyces roseochromogenus subsp. oscitans DS 12.976]
MTSVSQSEGVAPAVSAEQAEEITGTVVVAVDVEDEE